MNDHDKLRALEREIRAMAESIHAMSPAAKAAKLNKIADALAAPSAAVAPLDASMPERIWLQVDTDANNDERDEPFTGDLADLTWCAEQIGGLEVEYVRADLRTAAPASSTATGRTETVREPVEGVTEPWHGHRFCKGRDGRWRCADGCGPVLVEEAQQQGAADGR